jgi:acyl carrier protein
LLIARYLASKYEARLILIGRSGVLPDDQWAEWLRLHPDDEMSLKIRQLKELVELGATVKTLSADVANEEDMRQVMAQIDADFGVLHGVFHAAGIRKSRSASCPVLELGRHESEEQFRPKAYGLYVLSEVLRGRELDFCLLFSSNASILGGLGLGAYSAANHFMDAFALRQRRIGDGAWISANWDGWRLQTAIENDHLQTGLSRYAMSSEESLIALETVLQSQIFGQVTISAGDLQERLRLWGEREDDQITNPVGSRSSSSRHARPELKTPYIAPRNEIEREVARIWQDLIGTDRVGVDDNFFELEGHSLLATRILTRLRDSFGIKLPLRSFFESPTVAASSSVIASWLATQVDDETVSRIEEVSSTGA